MIPQVDIPHYFGVSSTSVRRSIRFDPFHRLIISLSIGAVLGSAIQLGLTFDSNSNAVSNSTFVAFLVLSSLGTMLPWALVKPNRMKRADGVAVIVPVNPSWQSEFIGLFQCLKNEIWILLLFPFFLGSK